MSQVLVVVDVHAIHRRRQSAVREIEDGLRAVGADAQGGGAHPRADNAWLGGEGGGVKRAWCEGRGRSKVAAKDEARHYAGGGRVCACRVLKPTNGNVVVCANSRLVQDFDVVALACDE